MEGELCKNSVSGIGIAQFEALKFASILGLGGFLPRTLGFLCEEAQNHMVSSFWKPIMQRFRKK